MKYILIFCINLILLCQTKAQLREEELVKKAFDNYKSAILNDNAEEALRNVDSRTVNYYTQILNQVKNSDSLGINSMSVIDKITILSIRARATREEILNMQGSELFIYAIKNGMVGKNSVINNSVGDISIDSSFAKGQLLVKGNKTPLYFHFYKEQNTWRLDITSLFQASNGAFKAMIEESGESENDYLFTILEALTGKRPNSNIWNPIR
jgi:hypothetical protein